MIERGHQPELKIAGFDTTQLGNLAECASRRGLAKESTWGLKEYAETLPNAGLANPDRLTMIREAEELALEALRLVKRGRGTNNMRIHGI